MKKERLQKIILMAPAITGAVILRISGLIGNSAFGILFVLDVAGAFGGVYWLHKSEEITDKLHKRFFEKKERL